jgi:hypothetical protein
VIPRMCDWGVVVAELFRKIRDLVPVVGAEIYDTAMRCRQDAQVSRETLLEIPRPAATVWSSLA